MSDCSICYEKFNKSSRKEISCLSCDTKICRTCIQTYLTTIRDNIPKCPDCNIEWTLEYISNITPKSYHNSDYRKHRTSIALDREKGLLIQTQPQAEIIIQEQKNRVELYTLQQEHREQNLIIENFEDDEIIKEFEKEIIILEKRIKKLRKKKDDRNIELDLVINSRKYFVINRITELENLLRAGNRSVIPEERKQFIKACPMDDCRGFLSTAWKCGICDTWICKDCHVKKQEKDDITHICDKDAVETAKLIAAETKPCPSCAVPIYKINGCFDAETQIIMWDGNIKNACDIVVGDKLIGDDGTMRTVQELVQGEDDMYKIIQYTANDYIVNSQHILSLKVYNNYVNATTVRFFDQIEKRFSEQVKDSFKESLKDSNIVEMTVKEYMNISDSDNKYIVGYKSPGVIWPTQHVEIDPYMLGLWLGNIETNVSSRYQLTEKLSLYNLVNNKHIPLQYIVNDRNTRLSLLAGIIDINGYEINSIGIIYKINHMISEQLIMLCKSLGFIAKLIITNYNEYEINLVGHGLDEIPTNIPIKNCISKDANDKFLNTSIEINPVGRSTYYGWRIDGNKRFLLKDFTVAHNCDQMWCSVCFTPFSWTSGKKVTGVIHNPHYYEWQRQQNNGVAPRVAGDIVCGGLPDIIVLDRYLLQENISSRIISQKAINDRHRIVNHILHVDIPRYNVDAGDIYEQLRLNFLLKIITEKEWSSSIQKNEKKNEKNHAITQVLRMFTTIMTDMFNNILTKKNEEIINTWEEMEKLRKYTNDNLVKIYNRFNNITPYITKNWESVSITSKDKDIDIAANIWTNIYEIPTAVSNTIRLETDGDNNIIIGTKIIIEGGFCYPNLMAPDFRTENIIEIKYITFRITPSNKKIIKKIKDGKYEIQIFTKVDDNLGVGVIRENRDEFCIGDRVLNNANKKTGNILSISSDKNMCKVVYDDSRLDNLHKSVLTFSPSYAPNLDAFIVEDIIPFNIFREITDENIYDVNTYTFDVPIILKPGNIMSIVNKSGALDFTWCGEWTIFDPVKFRYLYAFNYGEKVGDIIHRIQKADQLKPGFNFGININ